jgi:hypothetical protein
MPFFLIIIDYHHQYTAVIFNLFEHYINLNNILSNHFKQFLTHFAHFMIITNHFLYNKTSLSLYYYRE